MPSARFSLVAAALFCLCALPVAAEDVAKPDAPVQAAPAQAAPAKTDAKAAPKIDPAYVGLWQYPGHTVWIEIKADGNATQCRIDKGDPTVYQARGKVTGDRIKWDTLWGTDHIKALAGAIVLQGKYGIFHYVTASDPVAEACQSSAAN